MTKHAPPASSPGTGDGTAQPAPPNPTPSRGRTTGPNIRSFLDLSTGHLTPEVRADLDDYEDVVAYRTTYGWLLYASEDPEGEWPPELLPIVRLARDHGCEYVLFDADAPVVDALPVFDAK
ncbi:DUF5983 family protein [Kitasatospora kifunensis]|uniref:DUF5983 domain-containing protein n=1 Tax=Kitasatospora kifunensis TaxID=58351 RepID=A0A7W7RCU8_KITKI|nr:hypothetical protein [Kitasatospora kifunensis]MBB4929036.1 hypothetical protein [Kitasatospora kifunensis]